MVKLFISYRRKNWPFTHRVAEELEKKLYVDVFVDYKSIDQDSFETSIISNLRMSNAVLLIISEATFSDRIHRDDDWVRCEIREALSNNIPLILVAIDGLLPPEGLPADIQPVTSKQVIRFFPEFFDTAMNNLARFLVKMEIASYRSENIINNVKFSTNTESEVKYNIQNLVNYVNIINLQIASLEYFIYISEKKLEQIQKNQYTSYDFDHLNKQLVKQISVLKRKKILEKDTSMQNRIDYYLSRLQTINNIMSIRISKQANPVGEKSSDIISSFRNTMQFLIFDQQIQKFEIPLKTEPKSLYYYSGKFNYSGEVDERHVLVSGRFGDYDLDLYCSKKYFTDVDVDKDGNILPYSMLVPFFQQGISYNLKVLFFLLAQEGSRIIGSPLTLILGR